MKKLFIEPFQMIAGLYIFSLFFITFLTIYKENKNNIEERIEKEITRGYINPNAKDTTIWVLEKDNGHVPKRTVEVVLKNGETVKAVIPEYMRTYCVRYRDYPVTKGKRVIVNLEKDKAGGEYIIIWGDIEK